MKYMRLLLWRAVVSALSPAPPLSMRSVFVSWVLVVSLVLPRPLRLVWRTIEAAPVPAMVGSIVRRMLPESEMYDAAVSVLQFERASSRRCRTTILQWQYRRVCSSDQTYTLDRWAHGSEWVKR